MIKLTLAGNYLRITQGTFSSRKLRHLEPLAMAQVPLRERTEADEVRCRLVADAYTKKRICDLARANWQDGRTRFLTLTTAPGCHLWSLAEARAAFALFLRRLRRAVHVDVKLLAVFEKHEKGDYHVHALWFDFVPSPAYGNVMEAWGLGNVDVRQIDSDNVGYVAKYIAKDVMSDRTGWGARYVRTRNLDEPIVADSASSDTDLTALALWWTAQRLLTHNYPYKEWTDEKFNRSVKIINLPIVARTYHETYRRLRDNVSIPLTFPDLEEILD